MLLDNYLNKLREELSEEEYKMLIDIVRQDIEYNQYEFKKKPTQKEMININMGCI